MERPQTSAVDVAAVLHARVRYLADGNRRSAAIEPVAEHRAADVAQMKSDLMGAPRFDIRFHQGKVFSHLVTGSRKTINFFSTGRVGIQEFSHGFSLLNNQILPGFSKIFGFCPG